MSNIPPPEYAPIHQGVPPDSVTQAYGSLQAACAAWQKTTPSHDRTFAEVFFPSQTPCTGVDYSIHDISWAYMYLGLIVAGFIGMAGLGLWFVIDKILHKLADIIIHFRAAQ